MILPRPPTSEEKYFYVNQNKPLIYICGLLSFFCLIAGMVVFSVSHNYTFVYILFTACVFVYLGVSYFLGIFSKSFDIYAHNVVRDKYVNKKPSVDVYLPTCGESLDILENTYRAVRELTWPEGKLHIYVLDDKRNPHVKLLADRFEFTYITRKNLGAMKKAGNIRNAFIQTSSEFILILDADFVPRADMLQEMIPYFYDNEKTAIVQSPQFFSLEPGQTQMEKGSAYIQELFYRLIQVNRDHWSASICVGTCAIYRRRALEPHGGTYLIEYSEDLHTGWQVTADGGSVKYVPINLAKGMCPETMNAFFTQQMRWCTGSTSLLTSKKFWVSNLTVMQKLCYLSGMLYYVATALSVFLVPLPALFVVWLAPDKVIWFNYLFSLPSFIFGIFIIAIWGRAPFGLYVLSARQVSYYAHLFAIWGRINNSVAPWVPTGDANATKFGSKYLQFKQVMFMWVSVCTFIGIAGAFYHMNGLTDFNFYPLMFFSILNYVVAMRALRDEA